MSVSASVVPSRFQQIEKPPQYGEKPFVRLVDEAFNGAVLGFSNRLRLLEEANNRKIRRGDAIDLIASMQRRREKDMNLTPRKPLSIFATRYVAFAAGYLALAVAWCLVVAMH